MKHFQVETIRFFTDVIDFFKQWIPVEHKVESNWIQGGEITGIPQP